ncbi:MAG: hypothetical protein QOI82_1566 [Actinomycetota bacterium]|jgi:hypothetical protein|nr:hypothetical protein [Actinomycetota bacterium]
MTGYPAIAPHVDWVEIDDDVVSFDGELVHFVPGSGARIWRRLTGAMTTVEIASSLTREYGDAAVEQDVIAFVDDLVDRRLVQLHPERVGGDLHVPAHVAWTFDDAAVLLADLETGARRSLAGTGALVWELVVAGLSQHDVVDRLCESYPDTAAVEADVRALTAELLDAGLLVLG